MTEKTFVRFSFSFKKTKPINKAKIILVSLSAETKAIGDLVKAQTIRVYAKKELIPPKKNIFFPFLMERESMFGLTKDIIIP